MSGMLRWSEQQLAEHRARRGGGHPPEVVPAKASRGKRQAGAPGQAGAPAAAHLGAAAAVTDAPAAGMELMRAKGRLPKGEMNKTEARYAEHLAAEKLAGRVAWFRFEGITLKLAHDCRLTVDFAVMLADGALELHDVKGSEAIFTEDAKVKMRVAAAEFPFPIRVAIPVPAKQGGGWSIKEIGKC